MPESHDAPLLPVRFIPPGDDETPPSSPMAEMTPTELSPITPVLARKRGGKVGIVSPGSSSRRSEFEVVLDEFLTDEQQGCISASMREPVEGSGKKRKARVAFA
jgi:hypothetical protein